MKKISYYFLLLVLTHNFYAQDLYRYHQKYWYLRSKLRNDFMKIGTGQGESIPFTHRGKDANVTDPLKNAIGGGDLIRELGIYLGVLATEYRLLKNNYQNTDSVNHRRHFDHKKLKSELTCIEIGIKTKKPSFQMASLLVFEHS